MTDFRFIWPHSQYWSNPLQRTPYPSIWDNNSTGINYHTVCFKKWCFLFACNHWVPCKKMRLRCLNSTNLMIGILSIKAWLWTTWGSSSIPASQWSGLNPTPIQETFEALQPEWCSSGMCPLSLPQAPYWKQSGLKYDAQANNSQESKTNEKLHPLLRPSISWTSIYWKG